MADKTKLVKTLPPPKASDFLESDRDIYSEECSELLENLDNLEEEELAFDKPKVTGVITKAEVTSPSKKDKVVVGRDGGGVKLPPLELNKDLIETPKNQQKLTTPGE